MGFYLIARDLSSARLRWAGLGLVSYGLAIAMDLFASLALGRTAGHLLQVHWALMLLPATFWAGAVLGLFPERDLQQQRLNSIWGRVIVPMVILAAFLFALGVGFWSNGEPTTLGYLVFGLFSLMHLIALLFLILQLKNMASSHRAFGLVLIATLFFSLGAGMILLSSGWIPHTFVLL